MKHLIIFSSLSLFLNSCIKEECQITGGYYEFEIPATLTPAKDTFRIGDTITIVSSFPDEVYERKTNKAYKLEDFRFSPGTEINKIDASNAIPNITTCFDLLADESTYEYTIQEFSNGSQLIVGQYLYSNNKYFLEFKLIAKCKGLFYIEQTVFPDLSSNQEFEGKCSNLKIDAAVKMNDGTGNNIEMLSDSPDPHYNDWILIKPQERFHNFGGYCFYVKE